MAFFRTYNSEICRWLQIDPIIKFHESPYVGYSNNPITIIDPLGADTLKQIGPDLYDGGDYDEVVVTGDRIAPSNSPDTDDAKRANSNLQERAMDLPCYSTCHISKYKVLLNEANRKQNAMDKLDWANGQRASPRISYFSKLFGNRSYNGELLNEQGYLTGMLEPIMGTPPAVGLPKGIKGGSLGLIGLFSNTTVRGRTIIGIRQHLVRNGFVQKLARNKKGYIFTNGTGEEIRLMRRGSGWDI